MTGRRASQPSAGWSPPEVNLFTSGLARVQLHLEDDPNYVFDITGLAGHLTVRCQLAAAVAAHCASAEGWRRVTTVDGARSGLSAFLRWTDAWNAQHTDVPVTDLAHLTPFHLRMFRQDLASGTVTRRRVHLQPQTAETYYKALRAVLPCCRDLPDETRREVGRRVGGVRTKTRVERYSKQEFAAIKSAARRVLISAHARVSAAHEEALSHGRGGAPDDVRAQALYEVLTTGRPGSLAGYEALGATDSWGLGLLGRARRWLFLSGEEILAAGVVLACQRGLNLAPIASAMTPHIHGPGLLQLDLDKPRRGPAARFWPEIVSDAEGSNDGGVGNATAVQLIAEATEPARAYLGRIGRPSLRLFIRWSDFESEPREGIARSRRRAAWWPLEGGVHFGRLRRSVPGAGVAKEPTDHNATSYLYYVRTDPEALLERQEEAARGIQAAMDRARLEVHVKITSNAQVPAENDALIVNCADPGHHPATQRPCTSGFYSFLDCLDCGNAASVARLLPVQLATLQVLEELRGAMDGMWEHRFASRYYQLQAVVSRHTAAEREAAAPRVQDHVQRVLTALRQGVPR